MNTQIDELIDIIYNKYHGISRETINRIIKSEFKLVQETISAKDTKSVNLIHIGKFKPTPFRLKQLNKSNE